LPRGCRTASPAAGYSKKSLDDPFNVLDFAV
jgi:hypothetical protein